MRTKHLHAVLVLAIRYLIHHDGLTPNPRGGVDGNMEFPAVSERTRSRLIFVDATRGLAMVLVCLSHFGLFYFGRGSAPRAAALTFHLALPATTTFMLVSGAMAGLLLTREGGRAETLKDKLVDRGLFLLGPGHLLLRLAHWKVIASSPASSHWLFVTDAIGACLVVGAYVVIKMRQQSRALAGLVLFAGCWVAYLSWWPTASASALLKDYLIGEEQNPAHGVIFPILPWLAFYLIATTLGEQLGVWRNRGKDLPRSLLLLAVPLLGLSAALHVTRRLWHNDQLRAMLSAGQKYPPGPSYLLFGSGIAVFLLAFISWLEGQGYLTRLITFLATAGRASLTLFVVQYVVYYWWFLSLQLPVSGLWPLYFGLSLAFNFGAAWLWDRYCGNRYLTVGWPWFRRAASVPQAPGPSGYDRAIDRSKL
ncbi:MAG TPA: heparan-alpha-glucosaminide N-acetyltransferase domain-containing protein [Polyangiaceae bacterium]|nr:heparan-alpha-glucosaminide N-acetyltransferase domain-containing protein [Polyangiaceae bacterium]